jgi:hypothetical protein
MEYTTEFDEATGICTVRVTGRHKRPDDSMVLQRLQRDISDERGYQRFLFDMTQADIIARTVDTFHAGTVPGDPDHKQIRQRIALLYTPHQADQQFMETVAVNRGYVLRVFDMREKAVEWLTRKEESPGA